MPIPTRQILIALCFLLLSLGHRQASALENSADLVTIETGNLPIILSAPHGGHNPIPNVPIRQGKGVKLFSTLTDINTDRLTEQLADAIEKKLGKRPYLVIARFHRKYVDVNRRASDAFESPAAQVAYDTYHQALTRARNEVIERWGYGILLDIHGQSADPNAIFRGTRNGQTTTHLINDFGREALIGPTSLFSQLAAQGLRVIPAPGSTDPENPHYNGGYIVHTHGSSSGTTLDAIQLELGRNLRATRALPSTVTRLTHAIAAFSHDYLPQTERNTQTNPATPPTDKVRIGVYCDKGTGNAGPTTLLNVLGQFNDVSVRKLMADDIRSGALDHFDVLIHPGGSGSGQGQHLQTEGREKIRAFIADGGGFIGICAGAYLASADYSWSLNILDAKVLDRQHWARGNGMVEITLTDAGQHLLKSDQPQLTIYYAQGPLLAPRNNPDIPDYQTLATFKTEIARNGAPEGVMKNTTAIAAGQFGHGRVLCFSPHPEKTKGLEPLLQYAINHVKPHYPLPEHNQPVLLQN